MDTMQLATSPQCSYVQGLLKTRVVPSKAADQLNLVLDAGTLEKDAASVAIRYLLRQPYRPRYRGRTCQSRAAGTVLPCETDA